MDYAGYSQHFSPLFCVCLGKAIARLLSSVAFSAGSPLYLQVTLDNLLLAGYGKNTNFYFARWASFLSICLFCFVSVGIEAL